MLAYDYPHRELDCPIIRIKELKYKHFAIMSVPRTGSTLTYAITQYLVETQFDPDCDLFSRAVSKHHHFTNINSNMIKEYNVLALIPIRDPFAALASCIKLDDNITEEKARSCLDSFNDYYLQLVHFLEAMPSENILLFRYEEFVSDHKVLVDCICTKLGVEISDEERERASLLFSKQNVQNYTSNFKGFSQYDPVTLFHGNHISKNQKSLEELVSLETYNEAVKKLNVFCKRLGYPEREMLVVKI